MQEGIDLNEMTSLDNHKNDPLWFSKDLNFGDYIERGKKTNVRLFS